MSEAGRRALLAHQAQLASEGRGYWKDDGSFVYTDCENIVTNSPLDLVSARIFTGFYLTSCSQKPAKEGA